MPRDEAAGSVEGRETAEQIIVGYLLRIRSERARRTLRAALRRVFRKGPRATMESAKASAFLLRKPRK